MGNQQKYDEISLEALKRDIREYSWSSFKKDAAAALPAALVSIPQAMAYALVAGLPLSCGLFAAIFATIIAALFGSSRHLVIGPNNAIAILVQFGAAEILYNYYRDVTGFERELLAIQIVAQLAFLVGMLQILAGAFKLGRLTQFVSHSVVAGYLAGTALALAVSQLFVFFGIPMADNLDTLYERTAYILTHLNLVHIPTALIGLGSLTLLILLNRTIPRWPTGVIMLIISGLIVHFSGLSSFSESGFLNFVTNKEVGHVNLVGDAGEIPGIFPKFRFPFYNSGILNQMLPFAFAISLLSILETTAVAKSLAAVSGQRLSVNQEILGLGLGNLASSFVAGLPCAGSPSRSTIIQQQGGQTRFAAALNGVYVGVVVVSLGYFVIRTPLPALAAILLITATNIVNVKQFFLCLKATRSDAFVLIATFLSCLFFSMDVAFYIGIIISISLYLKKASVPHLVECTYDESGKLSSLEPSARKEHRTIRVINVQGELFFGAADLFQTALKSMAEDDNSTQILILRLKNARDLDATACLALNQLHEYLRRSGRYLLACGLTHQSWRILCNSGIVGEMGKENLFILDDHHPYHSLQKALLRAKELLRQGEEAEKLSRKLVLEAEPIADPAPIAQPSEVTT